MIGRISLAPLSTLISEAEAVFCLCAEVWNSSVVGTNTALATATINTRRNEDIGGSLQAGTGLTGAYTSAKVLGSQLPAPTPAFPRVGSPRCLCAFSLSLR